MKYILLALIGFVVIGCVRLVMTQRVASGFALMFIASVASYLILFPEMATLVANIFGVGRGTDFILYLLIIIVCVLIFLVNAKFNRVNHTLTDVVRKIAIDSVEKRL